MRAASRPVSLDYPVRGAADVACPQGARRVQLGQVLDPDGDVSHGVFLATNCTNYPNDSFVQAGTFQAGAFMVGGAHVTRELQSVYLLVGAYSQQVDLLFARFRISNKLKEDTIVKIHGAGPNTSQLSL
jgi:hypothetical protein